MVTTMCDGTGLGCYRGFGMLSGGSREVFQRCCMVNDGQLLFAQPSQKKKKRRLQHAIASPKNRNSKKKKPRRVATQHPTTGLPKKVTLGFATRDNKKKPTMALGKVKLYWMEGCPHCVDYKPIYKDIKSRYTGQGICFRDYERSRNKAAIAGAHLFDGDMNPTEIQGFPTVSFQHAGGVEQVIRRNELEDVLQEFLSGEHPGNAAGGDPCGDDGEDNDDDMSGAAGQADEEMMGPDEDDEADSDEGNGSDLDAEDDMDDMYEEGDGEPMEEDDQEEEE